MRFLFLSSGFRHNSYPLPRIRKFGLLKPHCAQRQQSRTSLRTSWPSVSLTLFGTGFLLGPFSMLYESDEKVSNRVQEATLAKTILSPIPRLLALFIELSAGIADKIEAYILFAAADSYGFTWIRHGQVSPWHPLLGLVAHWLSFQL
ncbi:hypothetical protein JHK87_026471 [Glycine soja]|nr:hypothetical protein JHK87_026471 [Glycine soja]